MPSHNTTLGFYQWCGVFSNDVMSCILSHRVWEERRYEAGVLTVYGPPATRWTEDIEQRIMTCIGRLVERVGAAQ